MGNYVKKKKKKWCHLKVDVKKDNCGFGGPVNLVDRHNIASA